MRRNEGRTIYGPYQHGSKWRLLVREGGRVVDRRVYDTREAAERVKAIAERQASGLTVEQAVERYVESMKLRGLKETTYETARYKLRAMFGIVLGRSGGPLHALTTAKADALYAELQQKTKVDTHRNTLMEARAFGKWAVKQGLLKQNPFTEVEPVGKRKKGKPQLSIDESRRYLAKGLELAQAGDTAALAAVLPLLLGLRASEVVMREVRDLDDRGRVLRVPATKTDNGRRSVILPEVIRPLMAKLAEGKRPTDRLFPDTDRHWLAYHVERLCGAAKVPDVCPHGLRGTHATLAVNAGATSEAVAANLGHSPKVVKSVTEGVYIAPGVPEQAIAAKVTDTLLN